MAREPASGTVDQTAMPMKSRQGRGRMEMKLSELGFRSGLELGPSPGFMCPHLLTVGPHPGTVVSQHFDNTHGEDKAPTTAITSRASRRHVHPSRQSFGTERRNPPERIATLGNPLIRGDLS